MSTTSPRVLLVWALAGLVLGWLVRPGAIWLGLSTPRVGWQQVALFPVITAVLGWLRWSIHRAVHQRRGGLRSHEAVNRLVLAKACALVGALAAGGYAGYALAWTGLEAEVAGDRVLLSLLGAVGAVAAVVAALLLERACRVSDGPDRP